MMACVVVLKDVQSTKIHSLLSLFTPAKTGEQLRTDLKRPLSERLKPLSFENDNYTNSKHGNNKQHNQLDP